MRVVRDLLIGLLFLSSCTTQIIPKGTYITRGAAGLHSLELKVLERNRFILTEYGDLMPVQGEGQYQVKKSKLLLTFDEKKSEVGLDYVIDSVVAINNKISILSLVVLDGANRSIPFESAFISLKEKKKQILTIFTDEEGKQRLHIYDSTPYYLTIGHFGYKTVNISINKLVGKRTNITVNLLPEKVIPYEKDRLNFKMLNRNDNQFTLKSKEREIFVFKKKN